jgi:hypothetical protein
MPAAFTIGIVRFQRFHRSGAALAAVILLSSCSGRVFVGLDEAFAAARPGLASELEKSCGGLSGSRYATISLGSGPSGLLAEVSRLRPEVVVTSPLFAQALLSAQKAGADGNGAADGLIGGARFVVAEWRGPLPEGVCSAATSSLQAFRRAGAASGAFIKALRASQGSETEGAILFSPSPERPREACDAFVEAFSGAAGFPPLLREVADGAAAQTGLEELLGSDLGLLFVASGSSGPDLCAKAARPSLAIGIALNSEEAYPDAAFCVFPDEKALASTLRLLSSKEAKGASKLVLVPARLEPGRKAKLYRAGPKDLEGLILRANREDKY